MTTREALAKYAAVVWEPDDLIELRPLPPEKGRREWIRAGDLVNRAERLEFENGQGANLYAGVLPRTVDGGGTDGDCGPGRVVWADFDGCGPREAWRRATAAGMPKPSMVVNSGHGAHLFWRLIESADPARLSALVGGVAAMVGSDSTVKNPSRILRLPGFVNWKEPKADAALLFADPSIRYPIEALEELVGTWQAENARRTVAEAGAGLRVGDGPENARAQRQDAPSAAERARLYVAEMEGRAEGQGRNQQGYRVAAALLNDFALAPETAWPILAEWNQRNNPPLPERELRAVLASGGKYAKHEPGAKLAEQRGPAPVRIMDPEAPVGDDLAAMREEVEAQRRGERVTIDLPWPRLSDLARPLRPGTVCVLAGPANTGKSFFAAVVAQAVHDAGYPWRYLPLEDWRADFLWRWLAIRAGNYRLLDDDPEALELRAEALALYGDELKELGRFVCQNPRVGRKDERGKTIVPPLPHSAVVDWLAEALDVARVVFIDPISQIEFDGREPHEQQADFIRKTIALASDSRGTVVLVAHTVKRAGKAATLPLSIEDIQGSAMIGRLCHTILLLDAHDRKTSTVYRPLGFQESVEHERTVIIAKVRNGPGARQRLAFAMGEKGPEFRELGVIKPKGLCQ